MKVRNKSVAVLDIRSNEICAVIAEKGVNNTFIIKSKYSQSYEGYAEGAFLDTEDFISAVRAVVKSVLSSVGMPVKSFYIGVPCEFVNVIQTDKVISFNSAQKISPRHLDSLENASYPEAEEGETVIKCSPQYYVLSDKRRLVNPVGMVSDSLRAKLSFFTCKDTFSALVLRAFKPFTTIKSFDWIPQNYAHANYLLDREKRGGYCILLDLGYISSTFNVLCGNGVAFSEAFSVGVGHVAVLLMEALEVPYDVALALIKKVNLNAKDNSSSVEEVDIGGDHYKYSSTELRGLIRDGLDAVCEVLESCIQSFTPKDLTGSPVYITGEGVGEIRGMIEHFSNRLVTPFEAVAPKLPYYDKPKFSSLFSLLSVALS